VDPGLNLGGGGGAPFASPHGSTTVDNI